MPDDLLTLRQELFAAWSRLVPGAEAAAIGRALLEDWAAEHRSYHNLDHLAAVRGHIQTLAEHATNWRACALAAWYHDVIHDRAPGAEERSARRCEAELSALDLDPELVAEVARLIRLTIRHDPGEDDPNGAVLCDADLAILAAPAPEYRSYTAAIRAEYAHLDDATFRAGRAEVLERLLDRPALYRTPHGQTHWEAPARANLTAELATLRT